MFLEGNVFSAGKTFLGKETPMDLRSQAVEGHAAPMRMIAAWHVEGLARTLHCGLVQGLTGVKRVFDKETSTLMVDHGITQV